jgi:transposase-like protein
MPNSPTPPLRHALLSVKEFRAELARRGLEVADRTVLHWVEDGKLQGRQMGARGQWHIPASQLDVVAPDWLEVG